VCRLDRSLFFDLNHLEIDSLVGRSLLLNSEDHDLVARQAEALLLCHLQHHADQAVLVPLDKLGDFVSDYAARRVHLSDDLGLRAACEDRLHRLLLCESASDLPRASQCDEQVHIIIDCNLGRGRAEHISHVAGRSLLLSDISKLLVNDLVVVNALSLGDGLRK